ncbi:hypothetical protein GCM10007386_36140 [Pseudoduganella dura]|nr:hypothetical protein GCM10007386_36140 [Pseudoduganella dura]
MKSTALLIAALVAPFAMPAAGAAPAVTATISYSQFKFSVVDLTPDDGVAAGFSLTRSHSEVAMQFIDSAGKYVGLSRNYADIAHEAVSLTHEGKELTVTATGAGSTASAIIPSAYAPRGQATMASTSTWEFTLAPNSLLVLTGEATLNVGISEVLSGQLRASTEFSGLGVLGSDTDTPSSSTFSYLHTTQFGQQGDLNTGFGLSLSNFSDSSQQGIFRLNTHNFARVFTAATPPPVPEPATYMMLVCGLVAMAVSARRRRASAGT